MTVEPSFAHPCDGLGYITSTLPGIADAAQRRLAESDEPAIKQRAEDFLVEEIPLYQPTGKGEHLYLFVQKKNMTTLECVRIIARHFNVDTRSVGYAGLKDARAITRQLVSVHLPGKRSDALPSLEHESIVVLWLDWHTNKLRRGHLAANRFSIRIRNVEPAAAIHAHRVLRDFEQRGVPNYFGPQRFGMHANNHLVGSALVREDWEQAVDAMLAGVRQENQSDAALLDTLPRSARCERAVVAALTRGASHRQACNRLGRQERSMFVSALQSAIFNRVLSRRVETDTLHVVIEGDIACRLRSRARFSADASCAPDASFQEETSELAVTPTGPMWGMRMKRAEAEQAKLELDELHRCGLTEEHLPRLVDLAGNMGAGERRPMRVQLGAPDIEGGMDEHGTYIRCVFELPRGAFATSVLREILKCDQYLRTKTTRQGEPQERRDLQGKPA